MVPSNCNPNTLNSLNGQWFNGGSTPSTSTFSTPYSNTFPGMTGANGINGFANGMNTSSCGNPMLATAILASCTPNPAAAFAYATALSNCFSNANALTGLNGGSNFNALSSVGYANTFGNALFGGGHLNSFANTGWNGGLNTGWTNTPNTGWSNTPNTGWTNTPNTGWNNNPNTGWTNTPNTGWNGGFNNGWSNTGSCAPAGSFNGGNAVNSFGSNLGMPSNLNTAAACSSNSPVASGTYGQWNNTGSRAAFSGSNCGSTPSNTGNAFTSGSVAGSSTASSWGSSTATESACRTPARAAA